ncbi:MAG TPA: ATP-binding protein [Verrucomicrobiae bacterium]|nr:ATP-binding protein [Verrucomicrobiae bacterium]
MNELCHPGNGTQTVEPQRRATAQIPARNRGDRRFVVNLPARLSAPGDTSGLDARILDVSRHGMRFQVSSAPPGPCVRVEWHGREFLGVIRHEEAATGGYTFGIELDPGSDPTVGEMLALHAAELEISNRLLREQNENLRRTKERLVAYAESLAKKNDDLCEASEAAHQASEFKSRFLASLSHELRTPLNGIVGFAQMFHDGALGPVTDVQRECLGDMLHCSDHMLTLIGHVIDLTKIETGKMTFHYQQVSLVKIIRDSIASLQPIADSNGVAVEFLSECGVDTVEGDPASVKQILYNYLSNALKFTPSGGRVQVFLTSEDDASYRIGVRDSGCGIAADDLPRLFVEFAQLHVSDKSHAGSGLGLAITRRIAEAQGGHVGAESELGRGSLFYAVLPVAPQARGSCRAAAPKTMAAVSSRPAPRL